jgi:hypothetical protein
MAVARTESTEGGTVGIPENSDSIAVRDVASADAEASAAEKEEGELPRSVAAAWGIGSVRPRAARPRRRTLLENILTCGYLEIE